MFLEFKSNRIKLEHFLFLFFFSPPDLVGRSKTTCHWAPVVCLLLPVAGSWISNKVGKSSQEENWIFNWRQRKSYIKCYPLTSVCMCVSACTNNVSVAASRCALWGADKKVCHLQSPSSKLLLPRSLSVLPCLRDFNPKIFAFYFWTWSVFFFFSLVFFGMRRQSTP